MDGQWLTTTPSITANEADHLVELWLRQRLTGTEQTPVDTRNMNLRDLAFALGAREEELALMLCELRTRKGRKNPKLKRAIPVRRSILLIAGIYMGMIALAGSMFWIGRSSAPQYARSVHYGPRYLSGQEIGFDRYAPSHPRLPDKLGFSYRNHATASQPFDNSQVNWDSAQLALEDAIGRVNGTIHQSYVDSVSEAKINEAVKAGEKVQLEIPNNSVNEFEYTSFRKIRVPDALKGNPLVDWDVFTLDYEGRQISILMPAPKVANPKLQKAVAANISERVKKLIEVLRDGKAATDVQIVR